MAYVITDACTKDFVCVAECATASIAPAFDDPKAESVSQLFINPDECIDCGNCASLCAQQAIYALEGFAGTDQMLLAAQFFQRARPHAFGQWCGAERVFGCFRRIQRLVAKQVHRALLRCREAGCPTLAAFLFLWLGWECRLLRCREAS